jgi:hypothetical protein
MKRKIIFISVVFLSMMLVFSLMGYLSVFLGEKKMGVEKGKSQLLPSEERVEGNIAQSGKSFSKGSSVAEVSLEPKENQEKASSLSERLIIFHRTVTLEVEDVRKSAWMIEKLADEYGGYIQLLRFGKSALLPLEEDIREKEKDRVGEGTIVVRIPAEKFKEFSQEIRDLGKLVEDRETAEEVTDRYIDLSARLRNLEKEEQRLLEIFNSARDVKEMLLVEKELQRIRGEIESLTAQKANLEKSARFAIFTIYLRMPEAIVSPPDTSWGLVDALRQAVRNFVAVVNGIIVVAGTILPLVIIGFIFYFGYKLRILLKPAKTE